MKISIKSLFCKDQNEHREPSVKDSVKQWILSIEKEKSMPNDIIALNFGLFEPYGIELTGSKGYDDDNSDWACDEDYIPKHRTCPPLNIPESKSWEEVLDEMTVLLKEVIQELPELRLWRVAHITTGFSDGDLVKIK